MSLRPRSTNMTCSARSFWSCQQVARERLVLLRCGASGAGSGNGVIGHGATFQTNQELRRRPDDLVVDEIEIEHVRRWVDRAQGTIDRERVDVARDVDALRENDLEDIPGRNVLPRRLDHLQISLSGGVRDLPLFGGAVRELAADRHGRLFGAEAGDQLVDPGFGSLVGLVEGNIVVQRDMGYGLDRPRQVIEHQQRVGKHPDAVRKVEARSRRRRHAWFKGPDRFVGEISDSAARKPRQREIRHLRRPAAGNQVRQRHERIVVCGGRRLPAD